MSNEWKEESGSTVTVFDRYHFAVPVRGQVIATNHNSFKVDFFSNNPGGHNVNKHDGKWFLKGQCKVDEIHEEVQGFPNHKDIMSKWWKFDHRWLKVDVYKGCHEYCYGVYHPDDMILFIKKSDFIGLISEDIPPEAIK